MEFGQRFVPKGLTFAANAGAFLDRCVLGASLEAQLRERFIRSVVVQPLGVDLGTIMYNQGTHFDVLVNSYRTGVERARLLGVTLAQTFHHSDAYHPLHNFLKGELIPEVLGFYESFRDSWVRIIGVSRITELTSRPVVLEGKVHHHPMRLTA